LHADVEISFEVNELEKAQALNPSWKVDPHYLCSESAANGKGVGLGPFGLLILASKDMQECTTIFFKVVRANKKHVVLMCMYVVTKAGKCVPPLSLSIKFLPNQSVNFKQLMYLYHEVFFESQELFDHLGSF